MTNKMHDKKLTRSIMSVQDTIISDTKFTVIFQLALQRYRGNKIEIFCQPNQSPVNTTPPSLTDFKERSNSFWNPSLNSNPSSGSEKRSARVSSTIWRINALNSVTVRSETRASNISASNTPQQLYLYSLKSITSLPASFSRMRSATVSKCWERWTKSRSSVRMVRTGQRSKALSHSS